MESTPRLQLVQPNRRSERDKSGLCLPAYGLAVFPVIRPSPVEAVDAAPFVVAVVIAVAARRARLAGVGSEHDGLVASDRSAVGRRGAVAHLDEPRADLVEELRFEL